MSKYIVMEKFYLDQLIKRKLIFNIGDVIANNNSLV